MGDSAMAKTTFAHRLNLHLDRRITLEAAILNRLACLPTSRRQAWLRGLLVDGFLAECQALRGVQGAERRNPIRPFANGMTRKAQTPDRSPTPEHVAVTATPSNAEPARKPFAGLGKVIG